MRSKVLISGVTLAVAGAGLAWVTIMRPTALPEAVKTALWIKQDSATGSVEQAADLTAQHSSKDTAGSQLLPSSKKPDVSKGEGKSRNPVAVEAGNARAGRTSSDIRAIGSLISDEQVNLASEVAGRIADIGFQEGRAVKRDDVVVRLDDALVKAEVADAKARFKLAEQNNARSQSLVRNQTVSGRTLDEAVANLETARAAYELALTRLDKHSVRAPFDGIAAVRNVSPGAYVSVGTPIARLEKIDVLKVDFTVPEVFLADVKVGQNIDVTVDAFPDTIFKGEIYAIDPLVDINGRALQVRARLTNTDQRLRPGLFARITIRGLAERDVTVVPESAVVPRGDGSYVFRISNGQAIESRVTLGARKNAEVEVLEGLAPDATVVTAGQQKLRNGMPVEIVSVEPAAATAAPLAPVKPKPRGGGSG